MTGRLDEGLDRCLLDNVWRGGVLSARTSCVEGCVFVNKNKLVIYSTASSLFQALSAFVLVVVVSHVVPAAEYIKYSKFMFWNQLLVVIFFEWLRIAALRHVHDLQTANGGRDLALIAMSYLVCCLGLIAYNVGDYVISRNTVLYELMISIAVAAQAFGDISLVMLRFGGRLLEFSKLQVYRNGLLMLLVVAVAVVTRQAIDAAMAVVVANLLFLTMLSLFRTRTFVWNFHRIEARIATPFVKFGIYAAAASVLHGLVTAIVRAHTLRMMVPELRAAGFSATFDLLQKPFPLVFAIVATTVQPEMYRLFDADMIGNRTKIVRSMTLIVGILLASLLFTSLGFYFIMPFLFSEFASVNITSLVVPIALYFFALNMLQSVVALVPHMMKLSVFCLVSAGAHLGLTMLVFALHLVRSPLDLLYMESGIILVLIGTNAMFFAVLLRARARKLCAAIPSEAMAGLSAQGDQSSAGRVRWWRVN